MRNKLTATITALTLALTATACGNTIDTAPLTAKTTAADETTAEQTAAQDTAESTSTQEAAAAAEPVTTTNCASTGRISITTVEFTPGTDARGPSYRIHFDGDAKTGKVAFTATSFTDGANSIEAFLDEGEVIRHSTYVAKEQGSFGNPVPPEISDHEILLQAPAKWSGFFTADTIIGGASASVDFVTSSMCSFPEKPQEPQ